VGSSRQRPPQDNQTNDTCLAGSGETPPVSQKSKAQPLNPTVRQVRRWRNRELPIMLFFGRIPVVRPSITIPLSGHRLI
jgi:hypothetical protein